MASTETSTVVIERLRTFADCGPETLRECRVCGTTLDYGTVECPACGSAEIATYEL